MDNVIDDAVTFEIIDDDVSLDVVDDDFNFDVPDGGGSGGMDKMANRFYTNGTCDWYGIVKLSFLYPHITIATGIGHVGVPYEIIKYCQWAFYIHGTESLLHHESLSHDIH